MKPRFTRGRLVLPKQTREHRINSNSELMAAHVDPSASRVDRVTVIIEVESVTAEVRIAIFKTNAYRTSHAIVSADARRPSGKYITGARAVRTGN
jgi:hypothetical protein